MAKDDGMVTVTVCSGVTLGTGGKRYDEGKDVRMPAARAFKLARAGSVEFKSERAKAAALDAVLAAEAGDGIRISVEPARAEGGGR